PPAPTTRTSTATLSARPLIARARRAPPDLPAPLDRPARRVRPAPPARQGRRAPRVRPDRPAPRAPPATRAPPGQQERPAPPATRARSDRRGPHVGTFPARRSSALPPAPTTRTSTATLSARPLIARARRAPPDLPAPLDRPARRGRRDRPATPA